MRLTLSTRNARAVVANVFGAADVRTQKAARATVKKYGAKQYRLTRQLAPVDTGFMRSRITLQVSEDGLAYHVGLAAKDFDDAGQPFYPVFVEFGTRHMVAQPFVFPARDAIAPEFRAELSTLLRRAWARKGAA